MTSTVLVTLLTVGILNGAGSDAKETKQPTQGRSEISESVLATKLAATWVTVLLPQTGTDSTRQQKQQDKQQDQSKSGDEPSESGKQQSKPVAAKPKPKPITENQRNRLYQFVRRHHPPLLELLGRLEETNPAQYEAAMQTLLVEFTRLQQLNRRAPNQYPAALNNWKIKSRIQYKAAEIMIEDSPEKRVQLRDLLRQQLDLRIKALEATQRRLIDQLHRTSAQLERLEDRETEIERSVKQVLRGARRYRTQKTTPPKTDADKPETSGGQKKDDNQGGDGIELNLDVANTSGL